VIPKHLKFDATEPRPSDDRAQTNTHAYPAREIAPSVVLEAFSEPIVFQRIFVDICHSVTAALMLSYAVGLVERLSPESEGWFEASQEWWTQETGLSRWEQVTARKVLRDLGFLIESRRGMPSRLMYYVDSAAVWTAVNQAADQKWRGL
jgi:hypothetical protein